MSFNTVDGRLYVESVPASVIAERFGTPCYVYSRASLETNWRAYDQAFGTRRHSIHYAVKANSNLALLNLLHRLGSGFDIVSGGELARVLAAGATGPNIVFSGVGKSRAELAQALAAKVGCINVESAPELERLNEIAAQSGLIAPIAFRVNPDVDPQTHPYISTGLEQSKFGIPLRDARELYALAARLKHIAIRGIACHIGSQLTNLAPIADAVGRVVDLAQDLERRGIALDHIDVGGGLGIVYKDETPPSIADYVRAVVDVPERFAVHLEPGRSIVGNAGILLSTVEYLKQTPAKHFAVCDAAMTELIRPALYQAWHDVALIEPPGPSALTTDYDVVGPVCETADFLAQGRALALSPGVRVALMNAGAYGFSMASNYNSRPRPPEVLVDGERIVEIRRRESIPELMSGEVMVS